MLASFCLPQAGQGLYNIALNYTLTVDDLLSVNAGMTTTSTLRIGQVGGGVGVGRWALGRDCWMPLTFSRVADLALPALPAGHPHPTLAHG